ncbi:CHAD domain-containing protein [Pseudanabaena sp. PCC 6802]|uniref:CHAD domain-containing protein n=1 Tax=Pseudanabaena sp. PCC 6802 TaxID=118173 RepID=UPI000344CCB2|nr:CHAD domain-containing protein [Pseudanabaena sp. PCC 6802]
MAKPKTPLKPQKPPQKPRKSPFKGEKIDRRSLTIGEFVCAVIARQYKYMVTQERGVLADLDPEYLHQMRVGGRRLSTALQVFSHVVDLPKAAQEKRVRSLTKTLGALRDLDVQIDSLREDYCHRVSSAEREILDKVLASLDKQRQRAFAKVESILTHPSYEKLKAGCESWLEHPQFSSPVHFPLGLLLPDLLSPLLSALLLHPGWSIPIAETTGISESNSEVLHDLRKTCKYVRYQAEFFTDFYGATFKEWIDELKELQDSLGKVQDMQVFQALLLRELPEGADLPELQRAIQDNLIGATVNWESVRQKYLSADFRYQLHQMILEPLMQQITT